MGFFDLKAKCAICNNDVGLNRYKLSKDLWMCTSCLTKSGGILQFDTIKKMSIDEIKDKINKTELEAKDNINKIEQFNPTKKIGIYFYIDEEKKQWVIPDGKFSGKIKKAHIYKYSDIVDFELIEDGNSIQKGGIGRAVAGGVLFGGVGAIVGGTTGKRKTKNVCSKLQIKITLKDMSNPTVYIKLIDTEFKKDSFIYKTAYNSAQEIMSILQLMCNDNSININNEVGSVADEIKKFKKLLDIGAITQEEFDKKKQELLK